MSPPFAHSKITLSCPLYASDFDPLNNDFLLVGGGGGEGRSGVGNKIVLLDTSKKDELAEIIDIDLSRNEDSVTSLAFSQSTDSSGTAFAGINSSIKEQEAGKNEHLRSFRIAYPKKKTANAVANPGLNSSVPEKIAATSEALGKVSYFTSSPQKKPLTFQRVLRFSRQKRPGAARLGAVATGLAPEGEIVLFLAETAVPSSKDISGRVLLGANQEAADVDILSPAAFLSSQDDDGDFLVAYCKEYDVNLTACNYRPTKSEILDSQRIYNTPSSATPRPKFRSVRFLTASLLLLLQNMPSGRGAELLLMEASGLVLLRKCLHSKIKSATALAASPLPIRTGKTEGNRQIQHVIAVAGADVSITILTLEHSLSEPYGSLQFVQHAFFPSVHPTSITSLALSDHNPPTTPWTKTPPQYLKLASTSIANTVVVHTFPLQPSPGPKKGPDEVASYLLSPSGSAKSRSGAWQTIFSVLMAVLAIGLGAFFLQAFTEIRGGAPEVLGAKNWLSERWQGLLARPYMTEDKAVPSISRAFETSEEGMPVITREANADEPPIVVEEQNDDTLEEMPPSIRDLLRQRFERIQTLQSTGEEEGQTDPSHPAEERILIHHDQDSQGTHSTEQSARVDLKAVKHDPSSDDAETHKMWEDLSPQEQEKWKHWLTEAGEWAADEGETVLKGIFFSGIANVVGAAVAG